MSCNEALWAILITGLIGGAIIGSSITIAIIKYKFNKAMSRSDF